MQPPAPNTILSALSDNCLNEIDIEQIARIHNVVATETSFIASDNIQNPTELTSEYIASVGSFHMGSPFKIRFTMLMFCISGEMNVQLNLNSQSLHAGEMLIVFEGTVAAGLTIDPSTRIFIIGFTQKFIDSCPPFYGTTLTFNKLTDNPILKLDEKEISDLYGIYQLIKSRLAMPEFTMKDELAWVGLQTINFLLADKLKKSPVDTDSGDRKQMLTHKFLSLVGTYASKHREISYYARRLCVSAKYLGQIITSTTGTTPHKWICRQVILEAKALLDDSSLTILQISDILNFPNQSFFGTFFRQHTGQSPKAYRAAKGITKTAP